MVSVPPFGDRRSRVVTAFVDVVLGAEAKEVFAVATKVLLGYNQPLKECPWKPSVYKKSHHGWGLNVYMNGRLVLRNHVTTAIRKAKDGADRNGRYVGGGVVCIVSSVSSPCDL